MTRPRKPAYDPFEGQDPLFDPWTDPATQERMREAIEEGLAQAERGEVVELSETEFMALGREAIAQARYPRQRPR
jgi:hypothetical protein